MSLCGVLKADVLQTGSLYYFEDIDLIVFGYPNGIEASVRAKRKAGSLGGRPPKNKRKESKAIEVNHADNHHENHMVSDEKTMGETIWLNHEENHMGKPKEGRKERNECKKRRGRKKGESHSTVVCGNGGSSKGSLSASAFPRSVEEVEAILKAEVNRCLLQLLPDDLHDCAYQYFNAMEGCGWLDSRGRLVTKWQAHAKTYAAKWAKNINVYKPAEESQDRTDPFNPRSCLNPKNNNTNNQTEK